MMIKIGTIVTELGLDTIYWDSESHHLYDEIDPENNDMEYQFDTLEDAANGVYKMYSNPNSGFYFEWIYYEVKPEYYDVWGEDFPNVFLNVAGIATIAREWEEDPINLMGQVEEAHLQKEEIRSEVRSWWNKHEDKPEYEDFDIDWNNMQYDVEIGWYILATDTGCTYKLSLDADGHIKISK